MMADSPSSSKVQLRKRLLSAGIGALVVGVAVTSLPAAAAQPTTDFPTDDKGFVDTAAHCEGSAVAMAFGRTERSLVAICSGPDGQYQYRGVRLSDDAALMLAAEPLSPGGFEAENDGVTYAVSPTELTVTSGGATLIRQSMIEYHEPRLPAEG